MAVICAAASFVPPSGIAPLFTSRNSELTAGLPIVNFVRSAVTLVTSSPLCGLFALWQVLQLTLKVPVAEFSEAKDTMILLLFKHVDEVAKPTFVMQVSICT